MQVLKNHIKNIRGWRTDRKLIVFAVDDYGNIRINSKDARESLVNSGVKLYNHFDLLDSIDTKEDYEMLFDVLNAVKDKNRKNAIFTTYSLPCNINFEESGLRGEYVPEDLNITYKRLSSEFKDYDGAYETLKLGIDQEFIKPQFHGREHLNIQLINNLFREKNPILLSNIKYKCMASIPSHFDLPGVKFNQSFAFWDENEIEAHKNIIKDGLSRFEKTFGYKSLTFTPPAQQLHPDLYNYIKDFDVISVDTERKAKRHLGRGKFLIEKNILGEIKCDKLTSIVRNCVFEPTTGSIDWVNFTFKQIEAAFFWNKPAIISSHRVNFCGHIDQNNRKEGLSALKQLLQKIIRRWPDVEFISVDMLVKMMNKND